MWIRNFRREGVLTPEQIQRAEELQKQYVQRTKGMNVPSPASVIPAVNTGGNMSNHEWYKSRGANVPDITTQGVAAQQATVTLGGQHPVVDDTFIEGLPGVGSFKPDDPEDLIVPPSLEEQGVQMRKEPRIVSLSEYIKEATEEAEEQMKAPIQPAEPIVTKQGKELKEETLSILQEELFKKTTKQLKTYYKMIGGMRNVNPINNKNYLVNLILKLKTHGAQSEEEQE